MVVFKRAEFLPFSPPAITEEEIEAVVDTLRSGWLTNGPKTRQFEADFAAYIGVPKALGINSCTSGLHLALETLNIGAGDEVITTPYTFCASVNVIVHTGATPVMVDVEPDTLNIDPQKVAAAITPKTKAIIPVHFAGHPVDMDPILELAKQHNLYIVEDAAHAVPAKYKGRMVGSISDFTAFSFYATKNLTTGEGGMLTALNEDLHDRSRVLSAHGMDRNAWKRYSAQGNWYYDVVEAGFKYNMTDVQAAMGMVQLRRLEEMQAARRRIVQRYQDAFATMPEVQVPIERADVESAWHLYVLRLNLDHLKIDRAQFIDELKLRNIGTSVHFIPVHIQPYYRDNFGLKPEDLPIAYHQYLREVTLPLHPGLTPEDQDDVIHAVQDVVSHFRR